MVRSHHVLIVFRVVRQVLSRRSTRRQNHRLPLVVEVHEFDLRYLNPMYVASGNDPMLVWLIHMVSTLHILLIPQIEPELVLGVELVSALLL